MRYEVTKITTREFVLVDTHHGYYYNKRAQYFQRTRNRDCIFRSPILCLNAKFALTDRPPFALPLFETPVRGEHKAVK